MKMNLEKEQKKVEVLGMSDQQIMEMARTGEDKKLQDFYEAKKFQDLASKTNVKFAEDIYSLTFVSFLKDNVEKYKLDKEFGDKLAQIVTFNLLIVIV